MIEFFRKLFEWALLRSLSSFKEFSNSEALATLSHILNAENVWLQRLRGEDASDTFDPNARFSPAKCAEMAERLPREFREFLASIDDSDLGTIITYRNSQGTEYRKTVHDILMHVGLHSVYHRGQIAWLVREGGGTALNTDYGTFSHV